jgi:hypothetical protein
MQLQLGLAVLVEQCQAGEQTEIPLYSQQPYQLVAEEEVEIVMQQIRFKVQRVEAEEDLVLQQTAPWLEA